MPVQPPNNPNPSAGFSDMLAIGFGTTVAMWAVGYVGHMPLTDVSPAVFVSVMLVCLVVGGGVAGRYTPRGVRGGFWVGSISAVLNLLILGSALAEPHSGQVVPQAWLWIPGWFALSLALAGVGAFFGSLLRGTRVGVESKSGGPTAFPKTINWLAGFGWVTCAAALLLIAIGGLVTGFRAGMAVPDWPSTFNANMFLYPLAKMTGGVFYEHAHRLLGTLVGLATLTLAVYLTIARRRAGQPPKRLIVFVWLIGACVTLQGTMGGFRVTHDSHCLAVIHGFFAHAILGSLAAVAVVLWRTNYLLAGMGREPVARHADGSPDRFLTLLLVGVILLQTLLGTLVRQVDLSLLSHIALAAIVAVVSLSAGMRAWGLNPRSHVLRRSGVVLMLLVLLQISLGIVSLIFRTPPVSASPTAEQLAAQTVALQPANAALLTTAHQSTAALILALAAALAVYAWQGEDGQCF